MTLRKVAIMAWLVAFVVLLFGPPLAAEEPMPKHEPKSSRKVQEQKAPEPISEPAPPKPDAKPAEPAPKAVGSPILTVKLALMSDPRIFPYDINVEVKGDVAELSGKVATEAEKAAATEIAQGVEGIKSVTNSLDVSKDLPHALSRKQDDSITHYVKERFGKSKTLEAAHFDVKTDDGVVSLSGKTKYQVIVLEAAEAARQVPGVKAVRTEGVRLEGE
jgi:hyperosmotically inducible protein